MSTSNTTPGILYKKRNALLLTACFLLLILFPSFSQDKERGVNIGLVYPLSTHGVRAWEYSNVFSLNAFAGVSREEKAFTVAGFLNYIEEDASGFQAAGFANIIGGFAEGFKAAGFMNIYQSAKGFQAAGFMNLARRDVTGFQAAGFMNKAHHIDGFQAAGFFNAAANVQGSQAAGYVNKADDVKGSQFAGFVNIADDVKGSQFAGFINIAKKVRGVQAAGFINIADSSAYPIGIINIVKNGEKAIGLTVDDNLTTMLAFRSGGKYLYGIIGLGYNFQNDKHVLARQYGLGAHLITKGNFRLNTEATAIGLENFRRGDFDKFVVSVMPSLKLRGGFEIFGGPSFNYVNTNTDEGKKLVGHYLWDDTNNNNHLHGLYIGYTAGIHAMF